MATKNEDEVIDLIFARTLDTILFFTNRGRVFSTHVYELPEGSRTSRGAHMAGVLTLQAEELVTAMVVVPNFDAAQYITLITRQAKIKRMDLSSFANVRSTGMIAMTLETGDSLDWARLTRATRSSWWSHAVARRCGLTRTMCAPWAAAQWACARCACLATTRS